jgi:predicted nucleic acid-binding Zn ribbon protein
MHQHRPAAADHLARVWDVWTEAVGPSIARHARPGALHGRVLVVHVTNSTWLHQLRFMKADMLARLNQLLETSLVDEIQLKIGTL